MNKNIRIENIAKNNLNNYNNLGRSPEKYSDQTERGQETKYKFGVV